MGGANMGGDPDRLAAVRAATDRERYKLLRRIERGLETPMLVLALAWLALLGVELTWGESPLFETIGTAIWVVFVLNFLLEFFLAPQKVAYLRRNWLTALSLLLPALRVFRVFRVFRLLRVARVGRGLRLLRVVGSINSGTKALGASLRRRGFKYVVTLTTVVTFAGAAGMYSFENEVPGGLTTYGEALWWTAMLMTSLGSEYWPKTPEGRVLCFLLALYGFAVFGYVTATLATYFVGRDAASDQAEVAGEQSIADLRAEVAALREEIQALNRHLTRE